MHPTEGAGAEAGEGGATTASAGREGDEEWVQQASWGGAARGGRQVLVGGTGSAGGGACGGRVGSAARKVQTLGEKAAADESYEKR